MASRQTVGALRKPARKQPRFVAGRQPCSRRRVQQGARTGAVQDLQIVEEWFPLEEEAWRLRTNPRERSTKAISSSVISSVIALAKPANGRERTNTDEWIRRR